MAKKPTYISVHVDGDVYSAMQESVTSEIGVSELVNAALRAYFNVPLVEDSVAPEAEEEAVVEVGEDSAVTEDGVVLNAHVTKAKGSPNRKAEW